MTTSTDLIDRLREALKAAGQTIGDAETYTEQLGDTLGNAAQGLSGGAIDPFIFRLAIFVLAIFVGYYVVWSVTPALHTPLMSVTNAISSVIIVGSLLAVGVDIFATNDDGPVYARFFGFIALTLASVNIFGGFLVTQRMLGMYRKNKQS